MSRKEILRRIHTMVELLQLRNCEISFVLTDDKRIHQLNKIYRDKDRPTDVLAFAMREGDFAELAGASLGDVIVSVETAEKQARERRVAVLEEVTMLLAHGLLHLLGWDHETAAKDRRMRAETDRLCAAARPADRSVAGKHRPGTRKDPGETAGTSRSKAGAKRALSRNRTAFKGRGKLRKVEPRHEVKARRSPKK
jgi:probable rRNA maturation factor